MDFHPANRFILFLHKLSTSICENLYRYSLYEHACPTMGVLRHLLGKLKTLGTFKFFKMHLRVPFLLLALMEFCICVAAVFVAVYVRFDGSQITEVDSIRSPIATSMLFGLVMPVTMMAMGLYQSRFRGGILGVFLRSVIGFACGAAILGLLYYLIPNLYLGRGVFGLAILIAFFMVGTIRPMFFYYVDKDILKIRVLVLGTGKKAASIMRRLRRRVDRRGFVIVGYVRLPTDPAVAVESANVVDLEGGSLLDFAIAHNVDEIVVAADERRSGLPLEELLDCKLHGLDVIDLLSFFEREQGKLPLDILRPDWLIYSDGFDRGAVRDVSKRAFDFIASAFILSITWPFMLLAVAAIKIEDGLDAPVFYRQTRVGYLGKPFQVLKFRSMGVDAESDGVQWADQERQPRHAGREISFARHASTNCHRY